MKFNKPNILMIQADQITPLLVGAYGHQVVQTPYLDKLVAQGVRFDAAYTPQPVCIPARTCMGSGSMRSWGWGMSFSWRPYRIEACSGSMAGV
jgi:choline-sulfatase